MLAAESSERGRGELCADMEPRELLRVLVRAVETARDLRQRRCAGEADLRTAR